MVRNLYAIASVEHRYVKIGKAYNVLERFQTLQSMTWDPLWIAAWCGRGDSERTIHRALVAHHHRGEWFKPSLLDIIQGVTKRGPGPTPTEACERFDGWARKVIASFKRWRGGNGSYYDGYK